MTERGGCAMYAWVALRPRHLYSVVCVTMTALLGLFMLVITSAVPSQAVGIQVMAQNYGATYVYDVPANSAQLIQSSGTDEHTARPSILRPEVADVAKPALFSGYRTAAKTGASGAGNAANGVRLSGQLARESAESAFTGSGRLTQGAIDSSRPTISGDKLGNANLVKALTSDGSKIGDWGKYATQTYQSPSGNFQAHFYMNSRTGAVNYDFDYKVVFAR
mgnify:CR=1 FL=1